MERRPSTLTLRHRGRPFSVDGTLVRFSPHQCLRLAGDPAEREPLRRLGEHLLQVPGLALWGNAEFLAALVRETPDLVRHVRWRIVDAGADGPVPALAALAEIPPARLPDEVQTVFLAETRTLARWRMRARLEPRLRVIDPEVLPEISLESIPAHAWTPWSREIIYPIEIPPIEFRPGLDLLLIDCPARNLGLMPNGIGYVHNALKKTGVSWQTFDLDTVIYHRFHVRRLFDQGGRTVLPNGRELPVDPWKAEHYDTWADPAVIEWFRPEIDEIVDEIVRAAPKVLGLSIQECSERFSREVVNGVKARLPDTVIVVGGFSCYHASVGRRAFPEADFMCISEADLTVGPLIEALARGERPKNQPGVLSRFDDPDWTFVPGPMPHNLDLLEFPRYEWFDLDLYRNFDGYQLTPVLASRGCRWSRCTFCAERFLWRIHSPSVFVDELEWLTSQGCHLFMFNESDLNGMPEVVLEICDEIIRRGLNVRLTGQLRIHKKSDAAFFRKLREAGFVALRFGVDAFSANTLRMQKKGYTTEDVEQNLRDCWQAGIYTEVNWVIGVPGETETDVDESIDLIVRCKPWIGRLANINPLIMVNGSVYWLEPEKHGIVFHEPREALYERFPRAMPANLWHSENPFIDVDVRKRRFARIVHALRDNGFDVGAWASKIIDVVETAKDPSRSGMSEQNDPNFDEQGRPRGTHPAVPEHESDASGLDRNAVAASACEGPSLEGGVDVRGDTNGRDAAPVSQPTLNPMGEYESDGPAGVDSALAGAGQFRADSAWPEQEPGRTAPRVGVIRLGDERFVIDRDALASVLGAEVASLGLTEASSVDLEGRLELVSVVTRGANPELLRTMGSYNIVKYDGVYYGVPHACGAVRWGEEPVDALPGVLTARAMREIVERIESGEETGSAADGVRRQIRRLAAGVYSRLRGERAKGRDRLASESAGASGRSSAPRLVCAVGDYNVVEFEGWFYGLPQSLGSLDLQTVDVMEMPGVVRDVSRDVVEGEIRELLASQSKSLPVA